jgi:hypothetical protein
MTFEAIVEKFKARRGGRAWLAHCPGPLHARRDRHASLSIAVGEDGRTVLHCFAGCDPASILAAAGLSFSDLFADRRRPQVSAPPIVRAVERKVTDTGLWSRLTPTERATLEPTIILTKIENMDAAICRGIALAVEGELCQIVLKE